MITTCIECPALLISDASFQVDRLNAEIQQLQETLRTTLSNMTEVSKADVSYTAVVLPHSNSSPKTLEENC